MIDLSLGCDCDLIITFFVPVYLTHPYTFNMINSLNFIFSTYNSSLIFLFLTVQSKTQGFLFLCFVIQLFCFYHQKLYLSNLLDIWYAFLDFLDLKVTLEMNRLSLLHYLNLVDLRPFLSHLHFSLLISFDERLGLNNYSKSLLRQIQHFLCFVISLCLC